MLQRILRMVAVCGVAMSLSSSVPASAQAVENDYGYYDNYDAGYFDDNAYDDDWFFDYYDYGKNYQDDTGWFDWSEQGLFD